VPYELAHAVKASARQPTAAVSRAYFSQVRHIAATGRRGMCVAPGTATASNQREGGELERKSHEVELREVAVRR